MSELISDKELKNQLILKIKKLKDDYRLYTIDFEKKLAKYNATLALYEDHPSIVKQTSSDLTPKEGTKTTLLDRTKNVLSNAGQFLTSKDIMEPLGMTYANFSGPFSNAWRKPGSGINKFEVDGVTVYGLSQWFNGGVPKQEFIEMLVKKYDVKIAA